MLHSRAGLVTTRKPAQTRHWQSQLDQSRQVGLAVMAESWQIDGSRASRTRGVTFPGQIPVGSTIRERSRAAPAFALSAIPFGSFVWRFASRLGFVS